MNKKTFNQIVKILIGSVAITILLYFIYLIFSGKSKWSGRSMTLLDPTFARKYIPIIASVSEH